MLAQKLTAHKSSEFHLRETSTGDLHALGSHTHRGDSPPGGCGIPADIDADGLQGKDRGARAGNDGSKACAAQPVDEGEGGFHGCPTLLLVQAIARGLHEQRVQVHSLARLSIARENGGQQCAACDVEARVAVGHGRGQRGTRGGGTQLEVRDEGDGVNDIGRRQANTADL